MRIARTTPEEPRRQRASRLRHPLLWLGLGLVVVLGVVMAVQAVSAYRNLDSAADAAPLLRSQVTSGDIHAARVTAGQVREDATQARRALQGPHWAVAAALPLVGDDISAVRTVTRVVDDLASEAVPEIVDAAAVIDPASFAPRRGRIDLEPIRQVAPSVERADEVMADASARIDEIETGELNGRLRNPVERLQDTLAEASALTETAAKAAELLPSMLGAEGPRNYVVLAQNNAEPRALGGISGAILLVRANDGKITIREQRSAGDFARPDEPYVRLTGAERGLYGTSLATHMQNATAIPDFPRAAQIARRMWQTVVGDRVHGVASIDPVALQMLLEATGPVTIPGGEQLDGDNAAQFLLNQVYLDLPDPAAQDALFGVAAEAIFRKVMRGAGDLPATTSAVAAATRQGRVMLWSALPEEQEVLAGTPVAGELHGDRDGAPVVGVYLHDRTAAKMGFYQRMEVRARAEECRPGGGQTLQVAVTVSSIAPPDAASLPDYVTGGGTAVPPGRVASEVYLYAPTGATITDFTASEGGPGVATHELGGLHVVAKRIELRPGEEVTLRYRIDSPEDLPGGVRIRTTPGPVEVDNPRTSSRCS